MAASRDDDARNASPLPSPFAAGIPLLPPFLLGARRPRSGLSPVAWEMLDEVLGHLQRVAVLAWHQGMLDLGDASQEALVEASAVLVRARASCRPSGGWAGYGLTPSSRALRDEGAKRRRTRGRGLHEGTPPPACVRSEARAGTLGSSRRSAGGGA